MHFSCYFQAGDPQRLSLRLMPSVDFEHLMAADGYDVVSFIAGNEGDLLFQDVAIDPLALEGAVMGQQHDKAQQG